MFGRNKNKLNQKQIRALAWEEFRKEITPKVLEEFKNPGTYPTKINVMRTGEGIFLDSNKTAADAAKFINNVVCHRCQIINISAKADKAWLDQYIVTYWYIEDEANIFNEILKKVQNENQ